MRPPAPSSQAPRIPIAAKIAFAFAGTVALAFALVGAARGGGAAGAATVAIDARAEASS